MISTLFTFVTRKNIKSIMFYGHVSHIITLKDQIIIHVRQISADMLRAIVENFLYRMQLLIHQSGGHVEP